MPSGDQFEKNQYITRTSGRFFSSNCILVVSFSVFIRLKINFVLWTDKDAREVVFYRGFVYGSSLILALFSISELVPV